MELIVRIKVDVKHTGSSAVVVLTSTLDEDAMNVSSFIILLGSMGFQRFQTFSFTLP